jgi:hypothetical protein
MLRSSNVIAKSGTPANGGSVPFAKDQFTGICNKIARSMIGRTVKLLGDAKTITHGVVVGVFTEAGRPKLVVGGTIYDPSQVLTVTPT